MSLRDELQRPQLKALLIAGGLFLLLAVVVYFYSRNKSSGALAANNPNGLNADASGQVPTVLVLPPPVVYGPPTNGGGASEAPTVQPPLPAQSPPLGIISPTGFPPVQSPPTLPSPTGPLGIANH